MWQVLLSSLYKSMEKMSEIREKIPEKELIFSATRSSGPGGQNVNKVSSRIELRFRIDESKGLTADEKRRIKDKLRNRINIEGELIIVCQVERSQLKNREKAIEKFYNLVEKSLFIKPPRFSTKPTIASRKERLDSKKKRSVIKQSRGRLRNDSDPN